MGTCYVLLKDTPKKEAFDLEKGSWGIFYGKTKLSQITSSIKKLTKIIAEEVYYGEMCGHSHSIHSWKKCDECRTYFEELAQKLFDWCKEDSFRLEADTNWDSEEVWSYPVTQDRFRIKKRSGEYILPRAYVCLNGGKRCCNTCDSSLREVVSYSCPMFVPNFFKWINNETKRN